MTLQLAVSPRTESAAAVRNSGNVPGVVYGPKQEPISIALPKLVFEKTLAEAGESTIITLTGLPEEVEVLIHDVSFNNARGGVEHVDFYAIERGKELTTNVTLEFVGEAPVEKEGATVNRALTEVEVTCRPSKLPSHIDVDVSALKEVTDQILVSDLVIPEGVTVNVDADMPVATVSAARDVEAETTESEAVDMDAVEVEEKGKAEDTADTE
jgi:large subunit ribosomal protein L25